MNKVTTSHSTATQSSLEIIHVLEHTTLVTKISLGEIRHVSGGRRDIKCTQIDSGLKVAVRGNGAVQLLFIYTKNSKEVTDIIQNNFSISPK